MMLLQQIDDGGCPVEYLLSRIRVRNGGLTGDWQALTGDGEPLASVSPDSFLATCSEATAVGIWQAMLGEYRWLHRQMDDATRRDFNPFFVWLEMKTMLLCLRNMRGGRYREIDRILASSLLSPTIKGIFSADVGLDEAAEGLGRTLALVSGDFRGTAEAFKQQGIPGVERQLHDAWFRWVGRMKLHPRIAPLFSGLVDYRNIMRLYKSMRWELAEPPRFLAGGRIHRGVLTGIFTRGERSALSELLGRLGVERAAGDASPEGGLLEMIGRRLHRGSRGADSLGPIIEYLWRLYVETRNMEILLASAAADERQSLLRELPG